MMYYGLFLSLLILSACDKKEPAGLLQDRQEERASSSGSLLENTALSLNFSLKQQEQDEFFNRLKEKVIQYTKADILVADEQNGLIVTDWFYDEKNMNRYSLFIKVKEQKAPILTFTHEVKNNNQWIKGSGVDAFTKKITQNILEHIQK